MAISEQARHDLHRRLADVLGPDEASTLMAHLPPGEYGGLATKADLEQLAGRLDARFESLEARMAAGFESVDARFGSFEARMAAGFESVDARFESLEAKVDSRFESLEARMGARSDSLEAGFATSFGRLEGSVGRQLGEFHDALGQVYKELAAHTRTTVYANLTAVFTTGFLAFAAARL